METPKDEKAFIKGYNDGYQIANHFPEIKLLIEKAKGDSDRLMGLKAGLNQYELDAKQPRSRLWLPDRTQKSKRSRDDIEPER